MGKSKAVVLVVEDEDAIRLTLRDYLQGKGYTVLVSSDGVGAIKHLLDNPVDVIVTDYRMDILGGDYWIKFLEKYCKDKIVFITSGFLQPSFPISYEVLYKPYDYADLEGMIAKALSNRKTDE
jgi:CheY-like chemotaxis protein